MPALKYGGFYHIPLVYAKLSYGAGPGARIFKFLSA
jgi:hypothetical protein